MPGDDKKGDKIFCVPKATFFPSRRRQWAGFGWALWRRGAHAQAALTQCSEPRATSTADCHPCQGALCQGESQGHICAAMCRAAHKMALAWDQQHPLPGGKQPLTQILGNTQVLWAPPACLTPSGAVRTSLHPCPLK